MNSYNTHSNSVRSLLYKWLYSKFDIWIGSTFMVLVKTEDELSAGWTDTSISSEEEIKWNYRMLPGSSWVVIPFTQPGSKLRGALIPFSCPIWICQKQTAVCQPPSAYAFVYSQAFSFFIWFLFNIVAHFIWMLNQVWTINKCSK